MPMPVRNIPKNYRNVTGVAAYSKAVGKAMFESTLERDFLTLLEFNQSVDSFEVQPLTIHWVDGANKERIYTPDVLVYYHHDLSPPTLYEVKYRSDLHEHWKEFKPKFRAARQFAKSQYWRFKLITEKEIRSTRLDNAKFLLSYVKQGLSSEADVNVIVSAINILIRTTPTKLLQHIYQDEWPRAQLIPTLWHLIGTHQIGIDFDKPLTMSSEIWRLNT